MAGPYPNGKTKRSVGLYRCTIIPQFVRHFSKLLNQPPGRAVAVCAIRVGSTS
jgi:hypothetical protein